MKAIEIHDPVLGSINITEPLLLDLLDTKTVKRLINIHQSGATYLVREGRGGNRYEHSVGVMLLIRLLGGSVEEQAAGLLHDISHTAFSHVIDQVFLNNKETFHEENKTWFTEYSDVPKVLSKYGLEVNYIFNEHNWSILEQPQPDLCADRVDYTLRDLYNLGIISKKEIDSFLNNLAIINDKIVVKNIDVAVWFAKQYYFEVINLFMSPIEIFANNHLALAIRTAIDKGVLTLEDMLLKDDYQIIELIKNSHNHEIKKIFNDLNFKIKVKNDDKDFDYQGFSKPRIVDPLVLKDDGSIVRCSEVVPMIKSLHEEVREKASKGIFVKKDIS